MSDIAQTLSELWPGQDFTPIEHSLLTYLIRAAGRPVPRGELLREVWGYSEKAQTNTVQTTVRRLRGKIEPDLSSPSVLLTLRGRGYQLVLPGTTTLSSAKVVSREELERRLTEWLGPEQEWVTVLSPRKRKDNLVDDPSSFVGRSEELDALHHHAQNRTRLVTLHGAAGLGKTRLSKEAGRQARSAYEGGVWFCDLSDARTASEALALVADRIGLLRAARPNHSVQDQLVAVLEQWGPTLLVLDNFEQLDDEAAVVLSELLQAAPQLSVWVTSRRRLHIPGEVVLPLEPLPAEQALDLLTQRVEAVRYGPAAHDDPAMLAAIAQLLEGVPLALEMAAARARLIPLAELAARLKRSFSSLKLGRTGAPDRQQTLHQAIAWSWELLSDAERSCLVQLAVFRGGCDLEVAEAVIDVDGDLMTVLTSLLDKSMLRRFRLHGGHRLGLFESVREYALAKGDIGLFGARDRHAAWALEYALERETHQEQHAFGRLEMLREADNLVEAARWLIAKRSSNAVALVTALFLPYHTHLVPDSFPGLLRKVKAELPLTAEQSGRVHAELAWVYDLTQQGDQALAEVEAGLAKLAASSALRSELHRCAVAVLVGQGKGEQALSRALAAMKEAERNADAHEIVRLMNSLAGAYQEQRHYDEAISLYREGLKRAELHQMHRFRGACLRNLGGCLSLLGRHQEALQCFEQALQITETFHDPAGRHAVVGGLAATYGRLGRYAESDALFRELVAVDDRLGGRVVPGVIRLNAGIAALLNDDAPHAQRVLTDLRALNQRAGHRGNIAVFCLAYLAAAAAMSDDPITAADAERSIERLPQQLKDSESAEVALCLAQRVVAEARANQDPQAARQHAQQLLAHAKTVDPDGVDTRVASLLLERSIASL